jgi:hypothetical protein
MVSEVVTNSNTPHILKEDGYTADDGTAAGHESQTGRKCKNQPLSFLPSPQQVEAKQVGHYV